MSLSARARGPMVFVSLIALAVLPFLKMLRADFVWDDVFLVVDNPAVRELTWRSVAGIFTQAHMGLYSPVVFLSFAVEHFFFKLDPSACHAGNLALHALNVLAVYACARLLGAGRGAAWAVSALFAVHPVHVESVAWVSERKDLLYGVFYWASLSAYILFIRHSLKRFYAVSVLCFILSMLSKPMAVTLPLILVAYEGVYGKLSFKSAARSAPFFILALALGIFTVSAFRGEDTIRPALFAGDPFKLAAYCPLFYLSKIVWPAHLSALYPDPVTQAAGRAFYELSPWLALGALAVFFAVGRKRPAVLFGGLFFLISLIPVLQIVPVGNAFVADRYVYVALFGFLFMFTGLLNGLERRPARARLILYGLVGILAVAGAWKSRDRCEVWKNDVSLWTSVVATNDGIPLGHYNLGNAYHLRGQLDEALASYRRALALNPAHRDALHNSGVVLGMMGRPGEAIPVFTRLIEIDPGYLDAYFNRAQAYAMLGDRSKAADDARRVLKRRPDDASARELLSQDSEAAPSA